MKNNDYEMLEQMKDSILKNGKYVKVESIVGPDNYDGVYVNLEAHKVSPDKLAKLILAMDALKEQIIKDNPLTLLALSQYEITSTYEATPNREDK